MSIKSKKIERRFKIRKRIRRMLFGTLALPRLAVYKSNTSIYVQLIDDVQGHTLLATSSRVLGGSGINLDRAKEVGTDLAEKVLAKGIETVVFDRSGYRYHGRIKALAEAAKEKGLKF